MAQAALALALLCVPGCQGSKPGDAVPSRPGFTRRWWNLYEAGLQADSDGQLDLAVQCFTSAIKIRSRDLRRARTYGMHFTRYFPHRELGRAFLKKGRFDEAVRELELSIRQDATAKARFYLDEARRKSLESSRRDASPPVLLLTTFDKPVGGTLTVAIEGTARDDTFVKTIRVAGQPIDIEIAKPEITFSHPVLLKPGRNEIVVEAQDLAGRSTTETLDVSVDVDGPAIGFTTPLPGEVVEGPNVRVTGNVADASGVASLAVAGTEVKLTDGAFDAVVRIDAGSTSIPFVAHDPLGNVTSGLLPVARGPRQTLYMPQPPPWQRGFVLAAARAPAAISIPRTAIRLSAVDQQVVYSSELPLQIRIEGSVTPRAVFLSGVEGPPPQGPCFAFSQRLPMKPGGNPVHVAVELPDGTKVEKSLTLFREDWLTAHRYALGIKEFECEDRDLARSLHAAFTVAMNGSRRVRLVALKGQEDVLIEQQAAAAGPRQPDAPRLGKLIPAQGLLEVAVESARADGIEVFLQLINVETGEYYPGSRQSDAFVAMTDFTPDSSRIRELADRMTRSFCAEYPVVRGPILKSTRDSLIVSFGRENRVHEGWRLLVVRRSPLIDEISGQLIDAGPPEVLMYCDVFQLADKTCHAKTVNTLTEPADLKLREDDVAITQ